MGSKRSLFHSLATNKNLALRNHRKESEQMLWTYSASPNKYNIQFLLPPADEPKMIEPEILTSEPKQLTPETEQVLQNLCASFLTELGYSVTDNEPTQLDNNKMSTTIQGTLDMMHSFAMCATIRDNSMRPLFLFNTLMLDLCKLAKQQA